MDGKYKIDIATTVTEYFGNEKNIQDLLKCERIQNVLCGLVDKLATNFYLKHPEVSSDQKFRNEIRAMFGEEVKKSSLSLRLIEDFDFYKELINIKLLKTIQSVLRIGHTKIAPIEISVNRLICKKFLTNYRGRLQDVLQKVEKITQELTLEMHKKKREAYEKKLSVFSKEAISLTKTINDIERGTHQFITIRVPLTEDKSEFQAFSQGQIDVVINSRVSKVDPAFMQNFSELQKRIKNLSSALRVVKKRANRSISAIKADDLSVDCLKFAIVDKNYAFALELAEVMLNKFTKEFVVGRLSSGATSREVHCMSSVTEIYSLLSDAKKESSLVEKFVIRMGSRFDLKKISSSLRSNQEYSLKLLLNSDISDESFISERLNKKEAKFVELFSQLIDGRDLTVAEKSYLKAMFEESLENQVLSTQLTAFERDNSFHYKKYKESVTKFQYFTYKSRNHVYISDINKKYKRNLKLLASSQRVEEFEKLTQFEYGILCDIAKTKNMLDFLDQRGIIPKTGKLAKLYQDAQEVYALIEKSNKRSVANERYRAGDILMTHAKRFFSNRDTGKNLEGVLTSMFISKYRHAAQIYLDPEQNPRISHINFVHQTNQIQSRDLAISDVFRVDPSKLISKGNVDFLRQLYERTGLRWQDEVLKNYQAILQELYEKSEERFAIIKNDESARFRAGLADFGIYGGHYVKDHDPKGVHESMMGFGDKSVKDKMICSEFVTRSIVAAFVELNKRLAKQLDEKGISNNGDLITIPIPIEENLDKMHSQRLMDLLAKANCLKPVFPDVVISETVSTKNVSRQVVKDNVEKNLCKKMQGLVHKVGGVEDFVERGTKILEIYIELDDVRDLDTKKKILEYLPAALTDLYKESTKFPQSFVEKFKQFFVNLAVSIGLIESSAQINIKSIIKHLKKIETHPSSAAIGENVAALRGEEEGLIRS